MNRTIQITSDGQTLLDNRLENFEVTISGCLVYCNGSRYQEGSMYQFIHNQSDVVYLLAFLSGSDEFDHAQRMAIKELREFLKSDSLFDTSNARSYGACKQCHRASRLIAPGGYCTRCAVDQIINRVLGNEEPPPSRQRLGFGSGVFVGIALCIGIALCVAVLLLRLT